MGPCIREDKIGSTPIPSTSSGQASTFPHRRGKGFADGAGGHVGPSLLGRGDGRFANRPYQSIGEPLNKLRH